MAGRKLNANTALANPETGAPEVFLEGTVPPAWASKLIGAHLFGDGSSADTADTTTGPPPRTGKGSGREAWAAYAASVGVDVTDEMDRDEIAEAVEASQSAAS